MNKRGFEATAVLLKRRSRKRREVLSPRCEERSLPFVFGLEEEE